VVEWSNMNDPNESVDPPSVVAPSTGPEGMPMASMQPDFRSVQRRNLRRLGWTLFVLLGLGVIGGFLIPTPYVALVPGSARETEPLVNVSGLEAYPSDGEVLFTTVRLRSRPNLWEYLWLTTDDDANIVPEEVIYGDRSPDENRQANLAAMTDSKQVAVAVALEELGYEAITPTGVFVADVVEGSAADGILERGDVLLAVDGSPVLADAELVATLGGRGSGETVQLTLERHTTGEAETIEIVLGGRDDDPTVGFLGVAPQTRLDVNGDLPFEVDIDSGSVGGPSAGLAFTLAVLDQLTEGELTGGERVAVTGTISVDGAVGSVGGVPQKAAAVRELGIDVFIVPRALGEAELDLVRDRAGDDLQIVPVDDLDEALVVLETLGGDTQAIEEFAAGNL
jgi:PDZ domain-containing protein